MPTTIFIVEEIADNSNEKEWDLTLKILVVLAGPEVEGETFDCMMRKPGGNYAPASMGGWLTDNLENCIEKYPQFKEKK